MIIRVYIKHFLYVGNFLVVLRNERLTTNNDSDYVSQKCLISIDNNCFL
jgi:hypothetical protein